MYPVHRYMDPYPQTFPYQSEPNSYTCHCYPSWEAMRPQMKVDPLKYPSVFGPSPFNGNIGHPNPTDHSGCCHHSYPPGYYSYRPPFSHVPPPPQLYYYGPYPPYPDAYTGYFIPPHYSADQGRYDYDKARNHCYGCPNHTCHPRDNSSLKIEEQKPEKEQDRDFSSLIRLPNYPYPVMWVPSSYMKDKENDKASELQPGRCNGWVPLDINSLKGLRQKGEEKKSQQCEDEKTQSPFPIIWMPDYDKPGEVVKDLKETNATPNTAEEWPSKFKIIPLKLLENDNRGEKAGVIEDEPKNQVQPEAAVERESRTKTIPVKHLEERNEKKLCMPHKPEEKVDEKNIISERKKEESEVKKASEKKQSSPVRSSKLPPVCLRVDPLPRRKTTNGTSRSPSPPGLKEKGRAHQHNEEQRPTKETREEIPKKEIPVIDKKDKSCSQAEKEQKCQDDVPVASLKDSSDRAVVGEASKSEDSLKAEEAKSKLLEVLEGSKGEVKEDSEEGKSAEGEQNIEVNKGHAEASESKKIEEKKERRRDLSQSDAAVIIQSAYRGFEVRRWQPLEKLQKIARIREQVGHIRRQIQSIEASSNEQDVKQRVVISETIMNLLLQLDTIQGLHPSVREVRKSVARELICLQEKLDTVGSQVIEEQKSAKVEENPISDQAASSINSCLEAKTTSEQKSRDEKLDSLGSRVTEEPANVEENLTGRYPGEEVAFIASPSLVIEPTSEQESVQPADENSVVEEPSFENKQSDRSPAEEVAIVASPSLVNEPASQQETVQPADESSVAEKPSFVEEAGSDEEIHEERGPGEECIEKKSEEPSSLLKDEAVSSMYEEAPPVNEYRNGSEEVAVDSELVSGGSCKQEKPANAPVYAGEQVIQSTSEDVVLDLDVEELPEPQHEVKCQELEAVVPLTEGSGPMEKSARGGDVDIRNSDMSCPECVEGGDSVERFMEVNLEAIAREIHSPGVSECGKDVLLSASGTLQEATINEVADAPASKQEISAVVVTEKSSPGLALEPATKEADAPAPKEECSALAQLEGSPSVIGFSPMSNMSKEEKQLVEENEKLREMLERLLEAGKEQLGVISNLNGRVKDLERKLAQRKRVKAKQQRPAKLHPRKVSC